MILTLRTCSLLVLNVFVILSTALLYIYVVTATALLSLSPLIASFKTQFFAVRTNFHLFKYIIYIFRVARTLQSSVTLKQFPPFFLVLTCAFSLAECAGIQLQQRDRFVHNFSRSRHWFGESEAEAEAESVAVMVVAEKIKIGVCVMEKKVKCDFEVLFLYA